ncbi:MAG TPA: putative peptidoglycan glycosyltransferase FtsW [Ignavibacteria bacterium]|nr:cell cycle protein [Bacteroidota bacterium]HRE11050.1 putative peptidoglycan glycosyltransferase FtsW [Ignavibacteria bacterium]HRF64960.1 putative peptidoglycan glycosyltransferase FtsW [Ignavibacteria bacterium]HRJ03387.1 putative peptidoglycan glycosyltransferase FtsW [Ignavibacteria bacterium]
MEPRVNKIDLWILIPILALITFSLGVVYSASSSWSAKMSGGDSAMLFRNHLMRAGMGVFLIFLVSRISYLHLIKYRKYLMGAAVLLLLYLLFAGVESTKGAARWIFVGGFSFQPADFVKYALLINISYLLAKKKDYINNLYYGYLPLLGYVLLVVTLIAIQPNFSTATVIFVSSLMVFWIGKVKMKHMAFTVLSIVPAAVLFVLSKPYILNRIFSYQEHTTGGNASYQLSQAIIGFGNGGFLGVGPGNSTQRDLFLPQSYDDFVFSIVGEEYGFWGVSIVIILFAIFVFRGLKLSKSIQDDFGRYLAFGITVIIGMNAVINMMVATGIIPTTGQTLPFISYGGTSIIFNSIAVGILLNISTYRTQPKGSLLRETLAMAGNERD